jgi:hypothetical protein
MVTVPVTGLAQHTMEDPLRPAIPLQAGKSRMQDPVMTLTWMEWVMEKDKGNSCWFDFMEAPPVWKMRWFWISVTAVCVFSIVFFWLGL